MHLFQSVVISSKAMHKCGTFLEYSIEVIGEDNNIFYSNEHRLTFSAHFANDVINFKAHGSRVKKCPECKKWLPADVHEWKDADFD